MKDRCIAAVSQAIGREITKKEAEKIEERIVRNMRTAQRQDPEAWRKLSAAQRLQTAAALAADELIKQAERKKQIVQLTIQAHDRLLNYINDMAGKGMDKMEALRRTLVTRWDGKSNRTSAESLANAIRTNSIRQLIDTFEAVDPRFWGLMESPEGIRILTKEIFGESTGNAQAAKGAKAWLDVAGSLREMFNSLGGDIGKLEDWNLPQHHSVRRIAEAGRDKWIADTFGRLNRSKYLREDGTPMDDAEVYKFLQEAYETLSTGGVNKLTPGMQGQSMLANRRNVHREIHYKDADAYLEYQQLYGEKSLWGVITGHVHNLSSEISLLQTYGPNPDNTFKLFTEKIFQEQSIANPVDIEKIKQEALKLQGLYNSISGNVDPIVNKRMAETFDTLRNILTTRLASATITAISDEATVQLTARVNNLPAVRLVANELRALNLADQTEKNLAHRAGLGLDVMINHLNRWGTENLGPTFSSKMASTVMRMSGLEALDGARRRAFGATYMSALGEIVTKYETLDHIDKTDYSILLSKGITETDFQVWKRARLEDWGYGNDVLTPESIAAIPDAELAGLGDPKMIKMDATHRLLAVVLEETDAAVIRPGAEDRYMTGGGMERGTLKGELTRSFFQFKSFPIAMIRRHMLQRPNAMATAGGKATYIASLIAATTVLGAISQTVNDLLQGKNPRAYLGGESDVVFRNWLGAMLKGGSLGLYGDFLFSGATQHGQTGPVSALLGPVAGLVEESYNLTQGNILEALQGKDTNFGAELVRFARSNLPGANLWYAKAALDHMIFHNLQEYFSPGYLKRMEHRAKNEFGQTYYWHPGDDFSQMNAPDFNKAFGE